MGRLDDKVAIITGADGTIGLATTKLFLDEGAKVLLVGHQEAALGTAMQGLDPSRAAHCVADVSREDDTVRYFAEAESRFGGVDVLFANAGVTGAVAPLAQTELATFQSVMAVNVTGVFLGLKHAFPAMTKRGGGSVIITSSIAGIIGIEGIASYTASKHAEMGLMRVAAAEGGKLGIRVNAINPGMVDGPMMRELENGVAPGAGDAVKDAMIARIPLGRYATPEEIARLALFLASDDSSFTTASFYKIDGGFIP